MELLTLLIESAPIPVLLHDHRMIKAASQAFKSLWSGDILGELERCLGKVFIAGANLDQLIAGIKERNKTKAKAKAQDLLNG